MGNIPNYIGPIKSGDIHPISIPRVISLTPKARVLVDATFKASDDRATFGFTIKLNNNFLHAKAICGPKVFSSKEAKARAIRHAFMRAKDMSLARVSILSDSKGVVMTLNGSSDWSINVIVLDILNLSSEFGSIIFAFIYRRLNKVAHILTKVYYYLGRDVISL